MPMAGFNFRWAQRTDYNALGEVMFDAVRTGPSCYRSDQRKAWMPEPRQGSQWTQRLAGQHVILVELGGQVVGFMSLTSSGYVDFAYIRPENQRQGLFRCLYREIETKATQLQFSELTTHASLMARPAFEAVGWHVIKSETVEINGVRLERFEMSKTI